MEHILQFAINIDDDAIIRTVSAKAEKVALDEIVKKVEQAIYTTSYSGRITGNYHSWVEEEFNNFLEKHKEEIIARASDKLADKMSRTKRVREVVDKVLEVFPND